MFGGNASDDMKLKPLLVYHSENPRALKNIAKGSLPVGWSVTPKPGIHRPFPRTGFSITLSQRKRNIAWRRTSQQNILLLLDNALGHTPFMDDFHPNVKVVHLSPNTTLLMQSMD